MYAAHGVGQVVAHERKRVDGTDRDSVVVELVSGLRVTLSLDIGRPRRPTPVTSSHGGQVWCFFRTAYRFKDPRPALTPLRT